MCNNADSWKDRKSTAKEFMESLFQTDSHFEEEINLELQDIVKRLNTRALAQDYLMTGFPIMKVLKPHVIRFIWFLLTGSRLTDITQIMEIQRLAETFRTADPLLLILSEHAALRHCPYFSGIWKSNIAAKAGIREIIQVGTLPGYSKIHND